MRALLHLETKKLNSLIFSNIFPTSFRTYTHCGKTPFLVQKLKIGCNSTVCLHLHTCHFSFLFTFTVHEVSCLFTFKDQKTAVSIYRSKVSCLLTFPILYKSALCLHFQFYKSAVCLQEWLSIQVSLDKIQTFVTVCLQMKYGLDL